MIGCGEALMVPVLPITYASVLALQPLGVSPGNFVSGKSISRKRHESVMSIVMNSVVDVKGSDSIELDNITPLLSRPLPMTLS